MVDLKEAVSAANKFIKDAFSEDISDLQLEEISRSDDEKFWLITMGFFRKRAPQHTLEALVGTRPERVYKSIKVDSETGQAVSMQIRKL